MADAPGSGPGGRDPVEVRVLSRPFKMKREIKEILEKTLLLELSNLFSNLEMERVLKKTVKLLEKIFNVERVSIFKRKENKNAFEFFIFSKGERMLKKLEIPFGKGIVSWVYKKEAPLIIKDVSKDKRFYSFIDERVGYKTKSILAFPLKLKNRKYGVVELINKREDVFRKKEIRVCEFISPFITLALENAILFERLEEMFLGVIRSFARAVEAKDPYTSGHVERVENLCYLLAREAGLRGRRLKVARMAGILHDIGKIGIPDEILKKPGKLNKKEFDIIKKHVVYSKEIIEPIHGMEEVIPAVYYHHERYDGKGYPEGRKGKDIPLIARIVSIVDAFDAMSSDRPYRKALSPSKIIEEFRKNKGKQFDPKLVDKFLSIKEVKDILKSLKN